jgi:hypothetical protein
LHTLKIMSKKNVNGLKGIIINDKKSFMEASHEIGKKEVW